MVQSLSQHHGISASLAVMEGHFGLARRVLLKVTEGGLSTGIGVALRLSDEARLGQALRHPNLLSACDLGRDSDRFFLVREWVDGIGLRKLMRAAWSEGLFPVPAALRIGQEVCNALAYLHSLSIEPWAPCGIVHQAVTPSNILVTPSGEVFLGNLFLARPIGKSAGTDSDPEVAEARPRGAVPAYEAPEVANAEDVDGRADLFALATLLYEALVGPMALEGHPGFDWKRHRHDGEILAQLEDAALPPTLIQILERAMSPLPEDRPGTAQQLREELWQVSQDEYQGAGDDELRLLARQHFHRTEIPDEED